MRRLGGLAIAALAATIVCGCGQQQHEVQSHGGDVSTHRAALHGQATHRVGPNGGTVEFVPANHPVLKKAVLEIPQGALTQAVDFEMTVVQKQLIPSNGPRPMVTVHIEPSGTQFLVPAKLTYHYSWQAIDDQGGIDEAFVEIAYFDERRSMLLRLRRAGLCTRRHPTRTSSRARIE